MTLRLYGASSGYVDLDAPAVAGSASVTLPGSGTLATQAYADGLAGLTLITTQSFSAASSVSINNCFSATYANYLLIVNITAASEAGTGTSIRLRSNGTDNSSSNYYYVIMGWSANTANPTFFATGSNGAATSASSPIRLASGSESSAQLRISNPFATSYTTWDGLGTNTNVTTNLLFMQQAHCGTSVTTSYDGFSLIAGAGTMTGTLRVYGYKN